MELWIRSQDKKSLIKVNKVCFERNIDDEPTIYGYENYDNYERLGIYKTKERALEVLDEIEKILMPEIKVVHNKVEKRDLDGFRAEYIMQPMIEEVQVLEANSYVYKMPKE